MKNLFLCFLLTPLLSCSQTTLNETNATVVKDTMVVDSLSPFVDANYYKQFDNSWFQLEDGLNYIEMDGPRKATVGDSKISLLKIDPTKFDFKILSATQIDSISRCVVDWSNEFNLNVVINAGMYDLSRQLYSKAMLKNSDSYANNPKFYNGYNMMIAFDPVDKSLPSFDIIDLTCSDINTVKKNYRSLAQGMRMIDCNGKGMGWNKNPQWCSQLIVAKDKHQNIYFVFTRTPYSHNEMIQFMVNLEEPLLNAIYMEGGPQTSLFINTETNRIEKLGSYVSKTYATDKNAEFWTLPNIIGLQKRK